MKLPSLTNREIGCFASGAAIGMIVTGVTLYFKVIRKYIPLKDLEKEVDQLREQRDSFGRQIDAMNASYKSTKAEWEDMLEGIQNEYDDYSEAVKKLKNESSANEGSENEMIHEERTDVPHEINIGWDRVDGPFNSEEQSQIDECNGVQDLIEGTMLSIMEKRFDETIDPEEPIYLISEEEHNNAPDFIDTDHIDYYEGDDMLAFGRQLIDRPEEFINMICLNHFGKFSESSDPNVVWCRNDDLKTDYEIVRNPESYQEAIFGIKNPYVPSHRINKMKADEMEEQYGSR